MFKGMKGEKKQLPHNVSAQKRKTIKNTKLFWRGGSQLSVDFCFSRVAGGREAGRFGIYLLRNAGDGCIRKTLLLCLPFII